MCIPNLGIPIYVSLMRGFPQKRNIPNWGSYLWTAPIYGPLTYVSHFFGCPLFVDVFTHPRSNHIDMLLNFTFPL